MTPYTPTEQEIEAALDAFLDGTINGHIWRTYENADVHRERMARALIAAASARNEAKGGKQNT